MEHHLERSGAPPGAPLAGPFGHFAEVELDRASNLSAWLRCQRSLKNRIRSGAGFESRCCARIFLAVPRIRTGDSNRRFEPREVGRGSVRRLTSRKNLGRPSSERRRKLGLCLEIGAVPLAFARCSLSRAGEHRRRTPELNVVCRREIRIGRGARRGTRFLAMFGARRRRPATAAAARSEDERNQDRKQAGSSHRLSIVTIPQSTSLTLVGPHRFCAGAQTGSEQLTPHRKGTKKPGEHTARRVI